MLEQYIKQIKLAKSSNQLDAILKDVFEEMNIDNTISIDKYSKLTMYSICREIELGIWTHSPIESLNKEVAIKTIENRFNIKYF